MPRSSRPVLRGPLGLVTLLDEFQSDAVCLHEIDRQPASFTYHPLRRERDETACVGTRGDGYRDSGGGGVAASTDSSPTIPPDEAVSFEAWLDDDGRLRVADLPVQPSSFTECGICAICELPGPGVSGHSAMKAQGGLATMGEGWHIGGACLPGTCDQHHPWDIDACGPNEDDDPDAVMSAETLAALWHEIREGTVAGPDLVARYYTNVVWNIERQAIQVFSCTGAMVAHVPVKRAVAP